MINARHPRRARFIAATADLSANVPPDYIPSRLAERAALGRSPLPVGRVQEDRAHRRFIGQCPARFIAASADLSALTLPTANLEL
jgi:hypothetical protein